MYSDKKYREQWRVEKKQHEQKIESLESEKSLIQSAINKIKLDTGDKRQMLLDKQDEVQKLNSTIEKLDKDIMDMDTIHFENKETKNTMLKRIRELEAYFVTVERDHQKRKVDLEKQRLTEEKFKDKLKNLIKQKEQLEKSFQVGQKERLEIKRAQESRSLLHNEQMSKIESEKSLIRDHISKLKDKLKNLEMGIRGKKMEMQDLDTQLNTLVKSRTNISYNQ